MTPIEQLKAAGFNEKEIGDWSTQQRNTLSQAGFNDTEIDTYLGGPKEDPPKSFIDRLKSGVALLDGKTPVPAGAYPEVSMGEYGPGNFLIGLWHGLTSPASELKQQMQTAGPGEGAGALVGRLPIGAVIDQIRNGGESVGAAITGQPISAEEMFGNAMLGVAPEPISRVAGGPITRLSRDPVTGGLREISIGDLPGPTDFVDAAQAIARTEPPSPAMVGKLHDLWSNEGIHPGEVAHDAARDPTIAQDLLSTRTEAPQAYQRETPAEPARAVETPQPPPTQLEALAEKHAIPTVGEPEEIARNIVQRIGPDSAGAEAERMAAQHEQLLSDAEEKGFISADRPDEAAAREAESIPSDAGHELDAATTDADAAGISVSGRSAEPGPSEPASVSGGEGAGAGAGQPDIFFAPKPGGAPVGMGLKAPTRELTQAEQSVLSHIDVGGGKKRPPLSVESVYTNVVDRMHAIPERDAAGNIVPTAENPYRLMRMLAGNSARSQGWLRNGQVDFVTGDKIGPSLTEILDPVKHDLDPLRAYVDSVRALELEGKGIKTGFDLDAARTVAADGAKEFAPIMKQMVDFQNNLLKYMRDAGVLSDASYNGILAEHQTYMPFHAVLDEPGRARGAAGFQPKNPLFRIEGSERTKIDPIESIVQHTYEYVAQAERNKAASAMVDLLTQLGEAKPATDLTAAESKVRYFDKGEEKFAEVPREIADAVKNVDGDTAGFLARWLNSDRRELRTVAQAVTLPAKTLRAGATLAPDFIMRNPLRDYVSALLQSEKPIYTPLDSIKGFYSAITKDEYFRRWEQGGGGNAELVAMDRRYLQADLQKLTQDTGLGNRAWNVMKHPLDVLRTFSELGEQATRLGEFRYVYNRELASGASADAASRTAAFASREVTVDFARRGAVTQSLNMIDAFWNAGVQGIDRFARQVIDKPVTTSLKVAAGVTLPSVLLWYANHDDPRYREMPGWERDMFWNVMTHNWQDKGPAADGQADTAAYADGGESWRVKGGRYQRDEGFVLRLPKPFEAGVLFGSGVERALDAFFTDNPNRLGDFVKSIDNALVPTPGASVLTPFIEQFANKSTFTGQTLVPDYLKKELPEYQYTPYTTELTKKLGQAIGAFPGMNNYAMSDLPGSGVAAALTSPILIENYARAWTGNGGMYLLQAADAALRKQGILPDPVKPDDTLADIPFVKAFVVRYPSASTDSIQHFYDEYTNNQRYYTSWMSRAAEGDTDAMERIQAAGGERVLVQLDGIHEAMGVQSKLVRDIMANQEISSAEKRQMIDTIYYGQITMAQTGLDLLRQADQGMTPK